MKISVGFLTAPDRTSERIAIMHTTKEELIAHQKQLEELGIPSLVYDCGDNDFDKIFITSLGDFFVRFNKK